MSIGLKIIGGIGAATLLALDLATPPDATTPVSSTAPDEIPAVTENKPAVDTPAPASLPKLVPPPPPAAPVKPQPSQSCHPSYSGCLKVGAGDYDCAGGSGNGPNYTGRVEVLGSDPFDLDRDNDGVGCE